MTGDVDSRIKGAAGKLVAFRNDRLGARLLTLVNAMRLSADHNIPFACYWPIATDVTAVFNDPTELFEDDFVATYFIDRDAWMAARPDALRIGDATRQDSAYLKAEVAMGRAVAVDQAFGVNTLKDETAAAVRKRFVETLAAVPFSAALRPLIAELDQALSGATAYHIRRGDLTDGLSAKNKPWPHKMVPNEFYELHMESALGSGSSAILFSDDPWTLQHYTSEFPALRTIHDVISLEGLTEAQRDFIELYAMSRAARIIAPKRSAFSSTAENMGEAVKSDVTEDLTDDMRSTAYERLLGRLRTRPASFQNDGEIGQSLAHMSLYLVGEKRSAEAAELFADHLQRGLNIAFVYPQAMRHQHRADDIQGVLRTGELMHEREIFHLRYFVEGEFLYGYGLIRAGDWQQGLRRITNAFWHGPTTGETNILIPALVDLGILNDQCFLPMSRMALDTHRRQGPVKNFLVNFGEIVRLAKIKSMRPLGAIDTCIWDWSPLLRGVSLVAAQRQGKVELAKKRLAQLDPAADPPEHASLGAFLIACGGDPAAAIDPLVVLSERNPHHAMTWQRLSHALSLARHHEQAADAADMALRAAPDVPAFAAWAGTMHLRCAQFARAAAHLERAAAADIGLPSIHANVARAFVGRKAYDAALRSVEQANELAPMEADFALLHAEILEALTRREEAIAALVDMVNRYRAPSKLFRRLVELMMASGDVEGARRMINLCQARFPEHPLTQRLLDEMPA
ncbi:MAG: hypothetical protein AAF674_11420 [Pseudomonadota bacterium]